MPALKINVTGKSSVNHPPERCTLKFSVKTNGPQQDSVARDVTLAANNLQQWFKQFYTPGEPTTAQTTVTKFSTSNIKSWVKPSDDDEKPVADPHYAMITFTAVFQNFQVMGEVVSGLLAYPSVEIESVDWSLTDETGKRLSSATRKMALRDAIQKSDDLSEVLRRNVVAVEVSDSGYSQPMHSYVVAAANFRSPGGYRSEPVALDLTPQDIEVATNLQVTFEAI
jgi:uncharacterized protein YggE